MINEDNISKIIYEVTLYSTVTKKYTTTIEIPVDDNIRDHIDEAWSQVNFDAYDSIEEDDDYEYDEIGYITKEQELMDAIADDEKYEEPN